MENEFAHIELMTHDLGAAKEFYTELFNWEWEESPMEGGTYWLIKTGKDPMGGMMKAPEPDIPPNWNVYTKVENVAATLEKVKELGGEVFVESTPIPGMGAFGVFRDPTGGVMSIWEPGSEQEE